MAGSVTTARERAFSAALRLNEDNTIPSAAIALRRFPSGNLQRGFEPLPKDISLIIKEK
jgi:hypothetical protein